MGLSVPQYFNEYTVVTGFGPVHTSARWVCMKHLFFSIFYLIQITRYYTMHDLEEITV